MNFGKKLFGNIEGITKESPMLNKATEFLSKEFPDAFKSLIVREKATGQKLVAPKSVPTKTTTDLDANIFKRQTEIQQELLRQKSGTVDTSSPSKGNLEVNGKITIEVLGKDLELSGPVTKALQNATTSLEEKIYSMVENQAKVKGIKLGGKS
jgi:hypothetical protein